MHKILFFQLIISFVLVLTAYAEETSPIQAPIQSSVLNPKLESEKNNPLIQFRFEAQSIQYTSASVYDENNQQQIEIDAHIKKTGFLFSSSQVNLGQFSHSEGFYFSVPEFYIGLGDDKKLNFIIGRKKNEMSFIDSFYGFGLFNPYFTNDFIHKKEQGLTGLHLHQKLDSGIGISFSWLPIYMPNQEPMVHEKNKRLETGNRWAAKPPSQFNFAGINHDIDFKIRDYKVADIIQNQGQVIRLFYQPEVPKETQNKLATSIHLSYANKPLNAIPLSREIYGRASDFVGEAYLSPVVTYSEVKSADIQLKFQNIITGLSYVEDQVQNKQALPDEELQNLSPIRIVGLHLGFQLNQLTNRGTLASVTMASISGGEIQDRRHNGQESLFTFSKHRTILKKPITFKIESETLFIKSKPILADFSYTYDLFFKGAILSTKLSYELLDHLNLSLQADILGTDFDETTSEDLQTSFIANNKSNDRISGGIQYVF